MSTNKASTSKENAKFWVDCVPDMGRPITGKYVKVFLNGKEVTKDCFYARLPRVPFLPVISKVGLFKNNEEGKRFIVDNDHVASEELTGIIWWKYRKDKPECVRYF